MDGRVINLGAVSGFKGCSGEEQVWVDAGFIPRYETITDGDV